MSAPAARRSSTPREHRALTRLEERRRQEHALEGARVEGAHMDEVALTVHRRSMSL
jgi:flagellar biosynthesis chaperone FliJ